MRRLCVTSAVLGVVIAVTGCGSHGPSLSPACTDSPAALQVALRAAPGGVALVDGTRLSRCIKAATNDADLQNVGIVFSGVAEKLGEKARTGDRTAAVQLGYLIGATQRGASTTNGVMAELQRRIELVGGRVQDRVPGAADALKRGRLAGEATG